MTTRDEGFTVIEVLVAFAILSLALVGLYDTLAVAYRSANATRLVEEALAVGQSQIERIGNDVPLANGSLKGALSDGSPWEITVRETPGEAATGRAYARYAVVYEATNRDGARLLQLRTMRISRVAP
ncbi:MAG: prepilin-type N-terminal cleavage/methylation domain-containing protein [Hyphomicrobiaceae bacterium]